MRSLWRSLALKWLGGEGSAALSDDSLSLDAMFADAAPGDAAVYRVAPDPGTSQHAVLAPRTAEPAPIAKTYINSRQD